MENDYKTKENIELEGDGMMTNVFISMSKYHPLPYCIAAGYVLFSTTEYVRRLSSHMKYFVKKIAARD